MTEKDKADQVRIVEAAVATLCEHFEAVQILVSHTHHEGTAKIFRGHGNAFARLGMARQFLNDDAFDDEAAAIADKLAES